MGICSYCGEDGVLTREHIIPSWYYKFVEHREGLGFLDRAKKSKIIDAELVIKDVCSQCNSNELSALDGYGKTLFLQQLSTYVFSGGNIQLSYDYGLMSRWLMKVAFNSARAHNSDIRILSQYKEIILGKAPIPEYFSIRLFTIAPASEINNIVSIADKDENLIDTPDWFRTGVFRVKDYDSHNWALRHVTINSYSFLLFMPSLECENLAAESNALQAAINTDDLYGVELSTTGIQNVPEPKFDSISYSHIHIAQFPLTYKLINDESILEAIEGEYSLIHYSFSRVDIEKQDISGVLDFLNKILKAKEIVMAMKDKIEFSIDGYNEDPRELYEIPEVVSFLKLLNEQWPYWLIFQHPERMMWLKTLLYCICFKGKTPENKIQLDIELIMSLINKWFISLNQLCLNLAIDNELNKEISQKIKNLMETSFHNLDYLSNSPPQA